MLCGKNKISDRGLGVQRHRYRQSQVGGMIRDAHAAGAAVLVDAAQAMLHEETDVQALGCDFLAFSGHKVGR